MSTKTIIATDPYIATYNNFLTNEECEHFISISKDSLKRSLVSDCKEGIISNGRTSFNTWIKHNHDDITRRVGERMQEQGRRGEKRLAATARLCTLSN